MITVGTPVAATASTVRSTSVVRMPRSSACWAAAWIVGPSITGSLYGRPTSMTSQPESTITRRASMPPATSGNPAGR
jgi:hypothetical protein